VPSILARKPWHHLQYQTNVPYYSDITTISYNPTNPQAVEVCSINSASNNHQIQWTWNTILKTMLFFMKYHKVPSKSPSNHHQMSYFFWLFHLWWPARWDVSNPLKAVKSWVRARWGPGSREDGDGNWESLILYWDKPYIYINISYVYIGIPIS
jgi:hypothetical protein